MELTDWTLKKFSEFEGIAIETIQNKIHGEKRTHFKKKKNISEQYNFKQLHVWAIGVHKSGRLQKKMTEEIKAKNFSNVIKP